jgi:hypothetical protein
MADPIRKIMNKREIIKWWSVGAGSMDAVTGLLLIVAPLLVLRVLGIAPLAAAALIFLNWVGVFVLAVGLSYGLALTGRARGEAVWMFTGLVRILVAVFLTIRVVTGAMEPAWLLVAVSDGLVAAGQGVILLAGWWKEVPE